MHAVAPVRRARAPPGVSACSQKAAPHERTDRHPRMSTAGDHRSHADDATRMRLNQDTTSDYGAGAGKGGTVLGIGVPELKLAAPVFGEESKKLSNALTTLATTLDGLGKPWGQDEGGATFETKSFKR